MRKIYYAYPEFRDDLKQLIEKIDQPFDTIVPIARGGLSMGQMLGEFYGIRQVCAINTIGYEDRRKLEEVEIFNLPDLGEAQSVLVVDDIADSGETLRAVLAMLRRHYPHVRFLSATLFYKPTSCFEPTWWVKEPQGWIEFFWSEDLL